MVKDREREREREREKPKGIGEMTKVVKAKVTEKY